MTKQEASGKIKRGTYFVRKIFGKRLLYLDAIRRQGETGVEALSEICNGWNKRH
jgi:hypothetical protein